MKKILFRGIECFVCDVRVAKEERVEGYNYYALRHGDEDWGTPVTIEAGVMVNFWGTLATKEDLSKHKDVEYWDPENERWFIEIIDGNDEGVAEEDDETHLFYTASTGDTSINEDEEPIV